MRKIYLQLLLIILGSSVIKAQSFESFNFSGALIDNGWTKHSGSIAGQFQSLNTPSDQGNSLYFPNLANSEGNRTTFVAGNTEDVNKAISGITGIGYFSFLLNVTNTMGLNTTGDYFTGFGATTGTSVTIFSPRVYVKAGLTPNTFQLGIQNTTGGTPTQTFDDTEYPVGTTVFVVVKLDATVSPIQASLFVNPVPGSTESAPTISNSSGTNGFSSFASIFLRQGSGTGNLEIDEIRVGSTWESVTPIYTCNTTAIISPSACVSYTVPSGDETYTASGTYFDTIPNAALCDSIITINLTINPAQNSTDELTICSGDSYQFGTQNLTISGVFIETFEDINGCDSTVTLTLTVADGLNYYEDLDGDGFGNTSVSLFTCNPPADFVLVPGDCDDSNENINPGVPELCNGLDDDCNTLVDDNAGTIWYQDIDMDGFGNPAVTVTDCIQPIGYTGNSMDCDDTNANINPDATDIPDNGIDEDCSGADATSPLIGIYEFTGATGCPNESPFVTTQPANAMFSDFISIGTTCTAANNVFNMSGWNTAASIDLGEYNEFTITANDCQQMNLTKLTFDHRNSGSGNVTWYVRSSVDNYTTDIATGLSSSTIANAVVILGTTFSNLDQITFRFYVTLAAGSGTTWRQDNVSLFGEFTTLTPQTFYADADSDGFGDALTSVDACTAPSGYVSNADDCNDNDALINPNTIWFADADNDTFGDAQVSFTGCTPPTEYVLNNDDCDDTDNQITTGSAYYVDADGDGYGAGIAVFLCEEPASGYSVNSDDCDDSEPNVYPGAPEICDGLDNDCNGSADDGLNFQNWFVDNDDDGFGTGNPIVACESPGSNYVTTAGDCNDNLASVFPGADEVLNDGIDQNCDGVDGYLGLVENLAPSFVVAPNPSNGEFSVIFTDNELKSISLQDLNGKVCHSVKTQESEINLDLIHLEKGVYIMTVSNISGSHQIRIVLQ